MCVTFKGRRVDRVKTNSKSKRNQKRQKDKEAHNGYHAKHNPPLLRHRPDDWQVCELPQEHYMVQNASGDDICRILSAFGIDNADRIYTKGDLAVLKSNVKAF